MSSTSKHYRAPGGWEWPEDIPAPKQEQPKDTSSPNASNTAKDGTQSTPNATSSSKSQKPHTERHWRPRTCRICLETVLPTFHPPSDNLSGYFQSGYVSYDSEGGRLLRPCKCKGSSRYVHESCLQQWRHADPSYGRRNFWQCPTCGFRYRLERMQWGAWISSKVTQIFLTLFIFMSTIFLLGFVADPIINLYLDHTTVTTIPTSKRGYYDSRYADMDDESGSWIGHFVKGLASLGLLGFIKILFTMSPWQWWNLRTSGLMSGGGRGNTGRDRLNGVSWIIIVLGVCTFLYSVWKVVRAWSRRILEKAGERVMDVQGDDNDDDDE